MKNVERRQWSRLEFAIPLFVQGKDAYGREFTELAVALNISAGGALVALRSTVALAGQLRIEIPRPTVAREIDVQIQAPRMIEAKIARADQRNSYSLLGLRFIRPVTMQATTGV